MPKTKIQKPMSHATWNEVQVDLRIHYDECRCDWEHCKTVPLRQISWPMDEHDAVMEHFKLKEVNWKIYITEESEPTF